MELKITVQGGRRAPVTARDALRGLGSHLPEPVLDDIRLLVSELVTNSVRHGGAGDRDPIEIAVTSQDDRVRIEVADMGPGFAPSEPRPAADQASGWGLVLVERLADRWGVERGDRSRVWFELPSDRELQAA